MLCLTAQPTEAALGRRRSQSFESLRGNVRFGEANTLNDRNGEEKPMAVAGRVRQLTVAADSSRWQESPNSFAAGMWRKPYREVPARGGRSLLAIRKTDQGSA